MKSLFVFLLLITGSIAAFSQSQAELNKQANQEYKDADKKLNEIYQRIQKEYAGNKNFVHNLKDAQRIWIELRDAQLKMMYPESAKNYGSIFPVCKANYLTLLTQQRIETLRAWLTQQPKDGDVCTGSVGDKQDKQ